MPDPYSFEKRSRIKRKIDKEAERLVGRVGAQGALVICFFQEGEYCHIQDGGAGILPAHDVREIYARMAQACNFLEESGGEDVAIQ